MSASTLFTNVNDRQNEYGKCTAGFYRFTYEGRTYESHLIANGPDGLEPQFTLQIEPADRNFFAHVGADRTFFNGVLLPSGRFARSQAFAACEV